MTEVQCDISCFIFTSHYFVELLHVSGHSVENLDIISDPQVTYLELQNR